MFIREVKKRNSKNGKIFSQYQLVQASRIGDKVKQRSILYLGSDSALSDKENRDMLAKLLQAKLSKQELLFSEEYPDLIHDLANKYYEKFLIKYQHINIEEAISLPPSKSTSRMENVDIDSIQLEESRTFGGEHLCIQILERLDIGSCLKSLNFSNEEITLAQIGIIGRALFRASEYKTSFYLNQNSELKSIQGMENKHISHLHLYKIADKLQKHKVSIDRFLYQRFKSLFNIKDSLVIYDLSNTYFEGRKIHSKLAKFGRNNEKRNDCKQVVFTGVINEQGFIRHSRIYEGNTSDIPTLKDMLQDLKSHSDPGPDKIVVIDAGIASEDNLQFIHKEGLKYVCVSRKQVKDYQVSRESNMLTIHDKQGHPIDLQVFKKDGFDDTWMYVGSHQKRIKEQSMDEKISNRFEEELQHLSDGLSKKGTIKKIEKVWERIGRIKEKYRLVSGKYAIEVYKSGINASIIKWKRKKNIEVPKDKNKGVYFLRTNIEQSDEQQIWDIYNTIREVESTFRCLKSDLQIRPVYHQKDERVESHIYMAILAYQLVNTVRYMLKEKGIKHDWRNIIRIMNTQTIQSIILNTDTKKFSIRKPSRPITEVLEIYKATRTNSMIPDKKKYVVYH